MPGIIPENHRAEREQMITMHGYYIDDYLRKIYTSDKLYKKHVKEFFTTKKIPFKTVPAFNRALDCDLNYLCNIANPGVSRDIAGRSIKVLRMLEDIAVTLLLNSGDRTKEKYILDRYHPVTPLFNQNDAAEPLRVEIAVLNGQ